MAWSLWVPALWLLAWQCCSLLRPAAGGKVLVMPVDGSHWLSMKLLVEELTHRGHDVLVLVPETSILIRGSTSFQTEVFPVPYTAAALEGRMDSLKSGLFTTAPTVKDILINVQRLVNFTSLQVTGCEALLYNQPIMDKLKGEGYEVLLTDPFLPCGSILAKAFSIPAVYFLRGIPCGLDESATQCPTPLSYVPRFYSSNTDKMDFLQRTRNTMMYLLETYLCTVMFRLFDDLTSRYIEKDMTYGELISHGAIWLLRYDFTFEWPKPLMPNMVLIGGINCAKRSPLPADLEEFVDGSGDAGFIVFTLGSIVSNMPEEKARVFIEAFRLIPQRVVWRYTGALPDDTPKNVKFMKWLPQNDLLAHPKAKVFITHGGTHGIYEGICNGVPMVMMPLFGDQGDNVHRMVSRGVAERLSVYDVTSEMLLETINKVISDKSYKEKMEKLSAVHRDRPVEPLDLAVFWTEFVMRHKGADHLRPAAHDLNWIQYHSLDVIAILILIMTSVIALSLKCCLLCARKCCRMGTAKTKTE